MVINRMLIEDYFTEIFEDENDQTTSQNRENPQLITNSNESEYQEESSLEPPLDLKDYFSNEIIINPALRRKSFKNNLEKEVFPPSTSNPENVTEKSENLKHTIRGENLDSKEGSNCNEKGHYYHIAVEEIEPSLSKSRNPEFIKIETPALNNLNLFDNVNSTENNHPTEEGNSPEFNNITPDFHEKRFFHLQPTETDDKQEKPIEENSKPELKAEWINIEISDCPSEFSNSTPPKHCPFEDFLFKHSTI